LVSHLNPKRETGNNMSNNRAMEEISIPLVPANIMPEEPPQSWF
jgi:hypothetical protein